MSYEKIIQEARENLDLLIARESSFSQALWATLLEVHPADLAFFLSDIDREKAAELFATFPEELKLEVYLYCSNSMRVFLLRTMPEPEKIEALHALPVDELTDLFDHLSDEELKKSLNLLHQRMREKVISLLKFDPESAGGIMTTDVLTLHEDFTVEKSIKLLQRLRPSRDIHQQIFVINKDHQLTGHINLEDLVLQKPEERIASFMHKNELVARADNDREKVASKMVHYGLMTVPVVDEDNHFLGVIPSETLVDVIVEEASEDVQKMAALAPMKYPYFETTVLRIFYERSYILVTLLVAESFSGSILRAYEESIACSILLSSFIPMLISAGGNTSSQSSAMIIQAMASGEVSVANIFRFLRREFIVASLLSLTLGITSFLRVFLTSGAITESCIVGGTVSIIVLLSALLGSCIPFVLKRLSIDPAFSAGPFLATLMDIVGIFIYCYICKLILF